MSFEEKLRNIRERRGLTQQQVADLMDIDKSTYCGYETGKRKPDVQKLKRILDILNVSSDELLETEHWKRDGQTVGNDGMDDIACKLRGMSQQELEDVAQYIEFIKSKRK